MGDGTRLDQLPREALVAMLEQTAAERDRLQGKVTTLEEDLARHKAAYEDLRDLVAEIPENVLTIATP